METDAETLERLKAELKRIENAKMANAESARRSFEIWSENTTSKVGRAFGYVISVPKKKFGKIWDWLIS